MTPALLLWLDAGSPGISKATAPSSALCYLCGNPSPTGAVVRRKDALGPGYTDHDKAAMASSDAVCVPCVWLLGGTPPHTFRLWSVVYREDRPAAPSNPKAAYHHGPHTHCASKSDVTETVDVLLDPPAGQWLCTVAESGQIHLLPHARINEGREVWTVRYEREDVTSTPGEFARVLWHVCSLLAGGYIRDDLVTLDPHPSKLVKHGISLWREHAGALKQWRRSGLLGLAIALTRKETYGDLRDRAFARMDRRPALADGNTPRAVDDGIGNDRPHQSDGLVAAREDCAQDRGGTGSDVGRGGPDDGGKARDRDAARGVVQGDLFAGFGLR